jgi:general secretion pathway protein J
VNAYRNGFTLLELLLSILLLSMLVAAISGGIHLGKRSWEAGRAGETIDEVEQAAGAIRTLLSRTFLVRYRSQNANATDAAAAVFIGNESNCRFAALSQGYSDWGGVLLTEIGIQPSAQNEELSIWTILFRANSVNAARETMRKTSLLDGVQSFRFLYFGVRNPGQPPTWSPTWPEQAVLPLLVSFTIVVKRQNKFIEVSSTVAIKQ